jgi:hypothetical protein
VPTKPIQGFITSLKLRQRVSTPVRGWREEDFLDNGFIRVIGSITGTTSPARISSITIPTLNAGRLSEPSSNQEFSQT